MSDGVHAAIDANKSEAGVYNRELKAFGYARDTEEVGLVADQKPDP